MKAKHVDKLCHFTDDLDREWDLSINAGIYMSLQDSGIDIASVFSGDDDTLEEIISGDRMMDILGIIGMISESQREERGITKQDFYNALGGEVIENATLAFLQAIINFTAAPKRPAMLAVLEQVLNALNLAGEKTAEKISSPETTEQITSMINQRIVDL